MPVIEIQDAFGQYHRIDSSNPDTIAAWLLEQVRHINTVNSAMMDCRIRVYPLSVTDPVTGQGAYDWPIVNNQDWFLRSDKLLNRIIELLINERDKGNDK